MAPKVSFVVPCYKNAHFLRECIDSILSQTYGDFEVLIMDDCSPDNPAEVTRSLSDARVKHIRNELNLGHLSNYNKGIHLARGEYIWLISADDRLRSRQILERYVAAMEASPNAGFIFCPGVELQDGVERGVLQYSVHGRHDTTFPGHQFYMKLLNGNSVLAASGMVRRTCYEKLGVFPLDMPYAGDWFLWCLFALHFDVVYLAEPMVNYRLHELSLTNALARKRRLADNLTVLWRIQREAEQVGLGSSARKCLACISGHYSHSIISELFNYGKDQMTLQEFEESLILNIARLDEVLTIRARVYASIGDASYVQNDRGKALEFYHRSLGEEVCNPRVWVKIALLNMGVIGFYLRNGMRALRNGCRVLWRKTQPFLFPIRRAVARSLFERRAA